MSEGSDSTVESDSRLSRFGQQRVQELASQRTGRDGLGPATALVIHQIRLVSQLVFIASLIATVVSVFFVLSGDAGLTPVLANGALALITLTILVAIHYRVIR